MRRMVSTYHLLAVGALSLCLGTSAAAEVVRLEGQHRETFPNQGQPYERLTGRFFGELNPTHALNAIIADLDLAPRNGRGFVEYPGTFTILKPVDAIRGHADGNELSGVRSALREAPLGSYTGWNPIAKGVFKGRIQPLGGGISRSPSPRGSWPNRFLLQDDADRLINKARDSSVLR